MGDRCYLQLTLHGPINRPRDLVEIAKAIEAENFDNTGDGFNVHEWRSIVDQIATMWSDGMLVQFEMQECNYANIDDVEATLQDCGCAWSVDHAAGDGYPAGVRSWSKERGRHEAVSNDGMATIDAIHIRRVFNTHAEDDKLAAIKKLVDEASMAGGVDLPMKLEVGERVARLLAGLIADEALDLRKAS